MQQHGLARVERRVEPEPALGPRRVQPARAGAGGQPHVGDQEAVLEHLAGEAQAQQRAGGAAGAVAGHDPVGPQVEQAVGRADIERDALPMLFQADQFMPAAQLDQRLQLHGLHEAGLDLVLLQVDHGRHLVARLGQQVEGIGLALAVEHTAALPAHTFACDGLAHAEAVEDLQCLLGPAHGARATADVVVVVDDDDRHLAAGEVQRQRQAHGPGADDDDRMALRLAAALLQALPVGITGQLHGFSSRGPSTSQGRVRPSRCADGRCRRPRRRRGSRRRACSGRR